MIDGATILITGGLGAIGSALSREVLRRGAAKIIILDDLSSSYAFLCEDLMKDPRVQHIRASIIDDAALTQAFASRPSIVFHFAANFANQNSIDHPIRDCEVNSLGTMKMLEWTRIAGGVKKFLFASSSCIYGNAQNRGGEIVRPYSVETHDHHPETPYAINKLHGEYLVNFYNQFHKLDTVNLRYFNSFGPGELPGLYRNVVPNFFALAMQGKPLPITGDRTTSRDFNYIGNTVDATLLAVETLSSAGKTYNVGSGQEMVIYELAEKINSLTGNKAGIAMKAPRNWDSINHRCADIGKTVSELGYKPIIDVDAHLKETYDWLLKWKEKFPAM